MKCQEDKVRSEKDNTSKRGELKSCNNETLLNVLSDDGRNFGNIKKDVSNSSIIKGKESNL